MKTLLFYRRLSLVFSFLALFFSSCSKKTYARVMSNDSNYSLIIEQRKNIRGLDFFKQGEQMGSVSLDVSKIFEPGDGIFVCWNNEVSKLEVVVPHAELIEINIDTTRSIYSSVIPLNEEGLPNVKKYHAEGCFELHFPSKSVFPAGNATIQ